MFLWTTDMIDFMQDAARYGSYQDELADWVCAEIPEAKHVCDAGCGLGFLSERLTKRFPRVTAADISGQALERLRAWAAEERVSNLEILHEDLMRFTPDTQFDAMVFCLFGRMHEILRIAKRCGAGTVVAVKKAFTHHRFSVSRVPLKDETTEQAAAFLREHGVPFTLETREFDMGQPIRSAEDAVRFFAVYSKDAPGTLTQEAVLQKLTETGDKAFPYYVPQRKSLGRFTIHTADIPEEFV